MASALATKFRADAVEQRKLSGVVLAEVDFATDAKKQAAVVVAQVTANVLDALADSVDYIRASSGQDEIVARRRAVMDRNDAVRKAAARKDWDEFDRLASEPLPTG